MSARQTATLASVESFDRERIVVVRIKDGDRGVTEMRIERFRGNAWVPTDVRIVIPNSAIFLVADAMNRSCSLAVGDRR